MKPHLTAEALNSWDTAVKYQVYQSLGLLIISLGGRVTIVQSMLHYWAKHILALGILFFCGSLYLRSSSALSGIEFSWLGPIAPVGGILLMAGWVLAGLSFTSGK
jgi:uncharacterized membrane protein YgdD (TMEM256/DUF423 family)